MPFAWHSSHRTGGTSSVTTRPSISRGALIVIAALLILQGAWDALVRPRALTALAQGLGFSALATVVNGAWCAFLIVWGGRQRSPALVASGWHLLSDVATSLGVLIGLALAALTGWQLLDPLLATVVAGNILWIGWRLVRSSVGGLMDEAGAPETGRRIREAIAANAKGAIEAHDVRTRAAGRVCFVEFHLVVPAAMTVGAAHAICDRLEAAIEDAVPGAQVVIHIEPEREAKRQGQTVALD